MGVLYDISHTSALIQAGLCEDYETDYGVEAISALIEGLDKLTAMDESYVRGVYNSIKHSDVSFLAEATEDFVLESLRALEQASFQLMQLFGHQIKYLDRILQKDEKFVSKYSEFILSKSVEKFVFTGYWFTADKPVPNMLPMEDFIKEIKGGKKTLTTLTSEDVKKYEQEITYGEYPDKLRAKIARTNIRSSSGKSKLDLESYQAELFRCFRNGKDEPLSMTIDRNDITAILDRLSKTRNFIKAITKEQVEMRDAYTEAMNHIRYCHGSITGNNPNIHMTSSGKSRAKTSPNLNSEEYYRYIMLLSRKAQLHFYMYNIAYGEKMVAIRDCHKQDCEILVEFIKRMG